MKYLHARQYIVVLPGPFDRLNPKLNRFQCKWMSMLTNSHGWINDFHKYIVMHCVQFMIPTPYLDVSLASSNWASFLLLGGWTGWRASSGLPPPCISFGKFGSPFGGLCQSVRNSLAWHGTRHCDPKRAVMKFDYLLYMPLVNLHETDEIWSPI